MADIILKEKKENFVMNDKEIKYLNEHFNDIPIFNRNNIFRSKAEVLS